MAVIDAGSTTAMALFPSLGAPVAHLVFVAVYRPRVVARLLVHELAESAQGPTWVTHGLERE